MTWPSSDVNTTGMDAGTDTPPRAEILSWAQKFNQLRAHVSTFMQGLLTSADAAAVRSALDVPTRTGGGASGIWPISISGNAATVNNGVYTTGNQTIDGTKTFILAPRFQGQMYLGPNDVLVYSEDINQFNVRTGAPGSYKYFTISAAGDVYCSGAFIGSLTVSNVTAATAGASAGAVGTYALLFSATPVVTDSFYAGSGLRAQGLTRSSDNVTVTGNGTGPAQTGTWRCLGNTSLSGYGYLALFLRVS